TMADVNVNALAGQAPTMAPPMRTDDQILPHIRWVPIGKSNCYLDVEKSCQLDEQWFDLTKDTLRDAFQITPINDNQAFTSPPSSDALINFVNKLGYPKLVKNLSNVVTNDMFQPWRALTTIINLCLTGKTSRFERPRALRKHKFHPRPDSLLHLPNEEPVLGYLKFNAKGTKRETWLCIKKRKLISTLRSVDESVAEDVPAKEPQVGAEETDMQRALEESLKSMYDVPRGPLPPVVIREPESEKYQPLPEVPRKGKAKDPPDMMNLHHYAGLDPGAQAKGQVGPNPSAQDEGQAGSNPDEQAEGQAGPNPGNVEESQHMPSLVVHAGSDREHMDLDVVDVSSQPPPEQMDEGSSGTLSSLQHHTKDLSFGDLFFNDKPSKANNDKATAKTEAESMVSVTIQQDMSSIPPMTTPTIDLTSRPESPKVHQLKATTTETTTTTTTTLLPLPYQQQQSTIEAMMMKRIDTMSNVNVNAPAGQAPTMAPPIHNDDQILPHIKWVPIGKSNCYLDVEKSQRNLIYKIAVDILKCQLDEQRFDLTKNTLKDALQITPVNNNQAFTSPPSSDALINFVNEQHKFHPRPDSSLHLPNEEPVLGYLKFSSKGTKREVFEMPIPGSLITSDIQEASYYQEYLAKVAKHQRYLASETGSDPDSPTPKPTKTARKPKTTAPKADLRPPTRKPVSSLRSVDESVAEDVPEKEPRADDEEADMQRALEESLKSMYDVPRKGKEKVIEEQVARNLLNLQTPKKKSHADRYIFQMRTSIPTGSSRYDESSSLYLELELTNSEEEFEEDVPGADAGGQGKGQARPNPGAQVEGQAGPDPDAQDKGQARSNPNE
nr:hypothetical protein [Tanacetum cinerariifolium]